MQNNWTFFVIFFVMLLSFKMQLSGWQGCKSIKQNTPKQNILLPLSTLYISYHKVFENLTIGVWLDRCPICTEIGAVHADANAQVGWVILTALSGFNSHNSQWHFNKPINGSDHFLPFHISSGMTSPSSKTAQGIRLNHSLRIKLIYCVLPYCFVSFFSSPPALQSAWRSFIFLGNVIQTWNKKKNKIKTWDKTNTWES